MFQSLRKLYNWMGSCVHKKYAEPILFVLFFIEAICFLPTDPMLIIYCIERRDRALWYATLATIASVLGGITSYALGYTIWNYWGPDIIHSRLISSIISPETFIYAKNLYQQYDWLAILIAGFSPIPYKAATWSAGFCQLAFTPFIFCSIIARGGRFFLVAWVINRYGNYIQNTIDKYFNVLASSAIVIILAILWTFRS